MASLESDLQEVAGLNKEANAKVDPAETDNTIKQAALQVNDFVL